MAIATTIYLLVLLNVIWSSQIAYTGARDLTDGGYPIFGHVIWSFLGLLLTPAGFASEHIDVPRPLGLVAVLAIVVVPLINAGLIIWCIKRGQQARRKKS